MQLLFARMAPGMRRRAMTRLARFVTGSTLPSVLTEVRPDHWPAMSWPGADHVVVAPSLSC